MAKAKTPAAVNPDINEIKKALVSAGLLKSVKLSKAAEAKLTAQLADRGLAAAKPIVICRRGVYCIVVNGRRDLAS